MKKCLGCGAILQDTDSEAPGYTPKIGEDLCMRCFKLKHYGVLTNAGKTQDNMILLKKINKKKGFVIFLIDFLNIYEDIINIYKKITLPKILVITKSDLIPKNIKKHKLLKNIKDIYEINEDIILTSAKTKENIHLLENICLTEKNVIFTGFTNAGKSSIINTLIGSNITVSKCVNTTQEFIEKKVDGEIITDAPGFISNNYIDNVPKNIVKPLSYQLASKYYLKIANIDIASEISNNLTLYLDNAINVAKRKIKEELNYDIIVPSNYDLVIKGLGFIRFSHATKVYINIDSKFYEIRPTIIGGNYEQD